MDVVRELYALDPADFTAARTAAARDLAGDEARRVRALRRPTVAAWAVNRLVRAAPEHVDALVDLGRRLREAQDAGDGPGLRELDRERRTLTSAAVRATADLVEGTGQSASGAVLAGVESTLRAVVLDPDAAALVREGCLDRPLEASGFGSVASGPAAPGAGRGRPARRSRPAARRAGKPPAPSGPDPALVAEAERQLAAARATLEQTRAEADAADAEVDVAVAADATLESAVVELRRALADAEAARAAHAALLAALRERAEVLDAEHGAAELAVAAAERDRHSLGD